MANTARFLGVLDAYNRHKEALLEEFPELRDDSDALADTLEGETQLIDIIARVANDARRDEAMADGLHVMIEEESKRHDRLSRRARKQRDLALALMNIAGVGKIERPEMTLSVRPSRQSVVVTDVGLLPEKYIRTTTQPDKLAIMRDLLKGEEIPGASLNNGPDSLTIYTK